MDLFNDLAAESLDAVTIGGTFSKRDLAEHFVASLQAVEGSGSQEVVAFLDRMTVAGATKWLTDWLRRNQISAKTSRGAAVGVPEYAAVRDLEGEFQTLRLFDMTAPQLHQHIEKLTQTRDTLSKEITFLRDLVAALEGDDSLVTAGDAFRKLGLAA